MKTAPRIFESAIISDRIEPTLSLPIVAVFGYDADHDAWKVGVNIDGDRPVMPRDGTHALWVQRRDPWATGGRAPTEWRLYDIRTPLPAKTLAPNHAV